MPDPDPDDGTNARWTHKGLCSLSWESARSSEKQVRNESIVRTVPVQKGRRHHFCATRALASFCTDMSRGWTRGERDTPGQAGDCRKTVTPWMAAVSYIILTLDCFNKPLPCRIVSEGQELGSSYLEGSGSGCLMNMGLSH